MKFDHCSGRDFLTLHNSPRPRHIAFNAFDRDGLATSAPYDPARDIKIHGQRDLILADVRHLAAIASSLLAALEERLFRSSIHREVHISRVFTSDGDWVLNRITNPEAQNASRRGDRAPVD